MIGHAVFDATMIKNHRFYYFISYAKIVICEFLLGDIQDLFFLFVEEKNQI